MVPTPSTQLSTTSGNRHGAVEGLGLFHGITSSMTKDPTIATKSATGATSTLCGTVDPFGGAIVSVVFPFFDRYVLSD